MKLSILIASVIERKPMFDRLFSELCKQAEDNGGSKIVEVSAIIDPMHRNGGLTTGKKRQLLLEESEGDFVVFVDDDDEVSDLYVRHILNAIAKNPDADCIGIKGRMTTNGLRPEAWSISIDHKQWYQRNGVYYRTPNHISPIRRKHALAAGFPDKVQGEDYEYSMKVLPYLKVETKIDDELYHYKLMEKK